MTRKEVAGETYLVAWPSWLVPTRATRVEIKIADKLAELKLRNHQELTEKRIWLMEPLFCQIRSIEG
jgi:hypothetical protein